MTDWDPREDAWLSGFADGEGSFILSVNSRRQTIHPRFAVGLRADDMDVLVALQKAFGGSLCLCQSRGNDAPTYNWHVVGKRDLIGIVRYFERFPLHAKKARDFAIWRRAVSVYLTSSGRNPEMAVLRDALRAAREYADPTFDAPDSVAPFAVQEALEID